MQEIRTVDGIYCTIQGKKSRSWYSKILSREIPLLFKVQFLDLENSLPSKEQRARARRVVFVVGVPEYLSLDKKTDTRMTPKYSTSTSTVITHPKKILHSNWTSL